jgi:hypothetical protein
MIKVHFMSLVFLCYTFFLCWIFTFFYDIRMKYFLIWHYEPFFYLEIKKKSGSLVLCLKATIAFRDTKEENEDMGYSPIVSVIYQNCDPNT